MYLAEGDIHVFGNRHEINASYLIDLPNNFIDGFLSRPDFGKTGEASFWLLVLSIFLISTVESVLSAKAIDKLDPRQRKTNLNQDLAAMGISTVISGYLGGLPVITVISRSSVNINHGAKTRYSNLYYGLLILIFLFFLSDIIEMIPLSALAAILVYTGYKLASP
jgi:MFS superfamily sulfate permease-like transporter